MNPNFQNPFTQKEKSPEYPPFSKIQKNSNTLSNPHLSPINRVSILKTEEQKEIVRTNVYADNDSSGNKKEFCVVTEIIRRKSNIPLPSKNNTQINLNPFRFSFNQAIKEPPFNPNLNIDIKDSSIKHSQKFVKNDNYNEIVKRIASQLNVHIRPPSQGFFYFAMLKGNYPLMIIKKLEKDIVNHKIELNNDIFRIYSEKYMRYIELVKKIAHLLKANLKNKMFWENERYTKSNINSNVNANQNIQTEYAKDKIIPINVIPDNKIMNVNNPSKNGNIIFLNKNNQVNVNSKNLHNKTPQNIKSTLIFNNNINNNNQTYQTSNIVFTQKNMQKNNFVFKPKKVANNQQNNNTSLNNQKIYHNNVAVKNLFPVINPFSINQNKNNLNSILNNQFIMPKNLKDVSNNNNDNKDKEKTQTINLGKKEINNDIVNNNEQNANKNDIQMKDDLNKNSNDINFVEEFNINNDYMDNMQIQNNEDSKNIVNVKMIPDKNNMQTNNQIKNISSNNTNNNTMNNPGIIRSNNVQRIILSSKKSEKKTLQIKLSTTKKQEELKISPKKTPELSSNVIKLEINEINIPQYKSIITSEIISFVNNFYIFLSNNKILIESNVPVANEEKGQKYLKTDEFWEKYVNYLYFNYLVNNANKVSLYNFIRIIEEYFLWCENNNSESAKKFKALLIEIINKMNESKEIEQFLKMNKLNKIDDLFAKYEIFFKYGNEINKKKNELEIKIENDSECNCELCKNEKACLLKMSEINKKINTNVNVENILLNAEYPHKDEVNKNKQISQNNLPISLNGFAFNKSKTKPSFESNYQYLPKEEDKSLMIKTNISYSNKKSQSSNKKKNEEQIKENIENFIELPNNTKIEDFFKKEDNDENNKNQSENKSKNKSRKSSAKKIKESVSKKKDKKRKEKSKKNNKKAKRNSRNKSLNRKSYDSDSEKENSIDSEEENQKGKNKRTYKYPKVTNRRGKKK